MKRTIFIALLLIIPTIALAQAPVALKQVGGPEITTTEIRGGTYIRAARLQMLKDTLWVWVQHVTPQNPPDTTSANQADLVVWCYPNLYPHSKHALPDAQGRVAILREGAVLWIVPEAGKKWREYVD